MRSKTIVLAGNEIILNELKIKEIKEDIIPKIGPAWEKLAQGKTAEIVDRLQDQMVEIFPQLKGINLDECYPSEIEAFVEAWIDVNFSGLKRLLGPVVSLTTLGKQKLELSAVNP